MAEADGVEVVSLKGMHAAALRYFDIEGPFAAAVLAATGAALPKPLTTHIAALTGATAHDFVLAWSRPTETLALSEDAGALDELERRLAMADGGYVVNLSGGLAVFRLSGPRVADLLQRLGVAGAPRPGEARRGRLADVAVMTLCAHEGEVLLAVDRAYAAHLLGWIGETLADGWRATRILGDYGSAGIAAGVSDG